MNFVSNYFLKRKYDFFRDYIEVKKGLEHYANLSPDDFYGDDLRSKEKHLAINVVRNRATIAAFKLAKNKKSLRQIRSVLDDIILNTIKWEVSV